MTESGQEHSQAQTCARCDHDNYYRCNHCTEGDMWRLRKTPATSLGASMIARERLRQIAQGYDTKHDADHEYELRAAAVCYLLNADCDGRHVPPHDWPFEKEAWKPRKNEIENLMIAGAFIAAEIDRLIEAERTKREP